MVFYVFVDLVYPCLFLEGNGQIILGYVVHVQDAKNGIEEGDGVIFTGEDGGVYAVEDIVFEFVAIDF